jgi:hypothetical protein
MFGDAFPDVSVIEVGAARRSAGVAG